MVEVKQAVGTYDLFDNHMGRISRGGPQNNQWLAWDGDGECLGDFKNRPLAVQAVVDAHHTHK